MNTGSHYRHHERDPEQPAHDPHPRMPSDLPLADPRSHLRRLRLIAAIAGGHKVLLTVQIIDALSSQLLLQCRITRHLRHRIEVIDSHIFFRYRSATVRAKIKQSQNRIIVTQKTRTVTRSARSVAVVDIEFQMFLPAVRLQPLQLAFRDQSPVLFSLAPVQTEAAQPEVMPEDSTGTAVYHHRYSHKICVPLFSTLYSFRGSCPSHRRLRPEIFLPVYYKHTGNYKLYPPFPLS